MEEKIFFIPKPYKMFVKCQTPDKIKFKYPLVFVHGGCHIGKEYEMTPDGRQGWTNYFLKKGFKAYILDWPGVGRSHTQKNFDKIGGMFVVNALIKLITKIGPCILFTHSMSGAYGWIVGEKIPQKVKAIVAIAPARPGNIQPEGKFNISFLKNLMKLKKEDVKRFWANSDQFPKEAFKQYYSSLVPYSLQQLKEVLNIKKCQLKIKNIANLKKIKILIVTGDQDPRHSKEIDGAIGSYFRKNRLSCDFYWLPDFGIKGNGHIMMLEKNNIKIAKLIKDWIYQLSTN